ncbi:MAG: response regulator transcription factor [Gemmatimonas sp.]
MNGAVEIFKALNALPVSAAILDATGQIVAVNETWKDFGRRNGLRLHDAGIGSNYLRFCKAETAEASGFATELKALLAGRLDLLTLVYPCDSPDEKRWFYLIGMPLSRAKASGVALLHVNLTDMLPRDIGAKTMQITTGKLAPASHVDAISSAVERSVSETLSSQLNAIFAGAQSTSSARDTSELDESHRAMVRSRLSKRQIEVLRLLGQGKTNKEIAGELFRSPNTIKLHVSAILHQLKLKSRTQAALLASSLYKDNASAKAGGDVKSWKKTRAGLAHQRRQVGEMATND